MARLFYVHWNAEEASAAARALRKAGHVVVVHHSTDEGAGARAWKSIKAKPPDALVISLARLPSHGRRIAAVTQETKALRDLPVVFVDGQPEKVEVARAQFPKAAFATSATLPAALARLG